MPANFQRFLPLVLIFAVLVFVLPALLRKHRSSGPSASTKAAQTIDAMHLIDQAEQNYKLAHQRYTSTSPTSSRSTTGLPTISQPA